MKTLQRNDLNYINSGYKPSNLHKWGPGVRDLYALHYIVSGQGVLKTRNRVFNIHAGESFLIYPDTEVYYYPCEEDPWEYVWVEFNGNEAKRLLSMTQLIPDQPVVPEAPESLVPLFPMGKNMNLKPFEKMRADAQLQLLLSYYLEYYPEEASDDPTDYVWLAKEYMDTNYWKPTMTVKEIVYAVKIERSYLFRLFKEATGMSVSAYINAYRIQRACELLKSSSLSIKSIACSVGYKDQLYFSKRFKEATSHTPSEYATLHNGYMVHHRNNTQFPDSL